MRNKIPVRRIVPVIAVVVFSFLAGLSMGRQQGHGPFLPCRETRGEAVLRWEKELNERWAQVQTEAITCFRFSATVSSCPMGYALAQMTHFVLQEFTVLTGCISRALCHSLYQEAVRPRGASR